MFTEQQAFLGVNNKKDLQKRVSQAFESIQRPNNEAEADAIEDVLKPDRFERAFNGENPTQKKRKKQRRNNPIDPGSGGTGEQKQQTKQPEPQWDYSSFRFYYNPTTGMWERIHNDDQPQQQQQRPSSSSSSSNSENTTSGVPDPGFGMVEQLEGHILSCPVPADVDISKLNLTYLLRWIQTHLKHHSYSRCLFLPSIRVACPPVAPQGPESKHGSERVQAEAKRMFKRLALLVHPDKVTEPELKERANAAFAGLKQALDGLS